MEGMKKIGMFFAYWISTILGCFLTLFVIRFMVYRFNIASAIGAPVDKLTDAGLVFAIIGLVVAWRYLKKYN